MTQYGDILKKWQARELQSVAKLNLLLGDFPILFAYHSGKIENEAITYGDTREIFQEDRVVGYNGSPRTLFEIYGQKVCHELLKDKIVEKESLSISLVLEVHCALTAGAYDARRYLINGERPGKFKRHDYVIGGNEVGSPPEEVEGDLLELLEELNTIGGQSPLRAGAYFHARFEQIHPFADGNGRVGRTLLNYWLMTNDHPPAIVFDEDKRGYCEALQRYDEEETIEPLCTFLEAQTVKTWAYPMGTETSPEQTRAAYPSPNTSKKKSE